MLSERFIIPLIRSRNHIYNASNPVSWRNFLQTKSIFNFSTGNSTGKAEKQTVKQKLIPYIPIRPLKPHLTPLYVEKNLLNKGEIPGKIPFWPYLTPFLAVIANNFLTSWTILNSSLASILLVAGIIVRQMPNQRRERQIIKFECNSDMSKFYMTIPYSWRSSYMQQEYQKHYFGHQQWEVFTPEQLKNNQYVPTEADKRTFSPQTLQDKRIQFDQELSKKIIKESKLQMTVARFELDAQSTLFKLSNLYQDTIKDHQVIHPTMPLKFAELQKLPFRYLIVRTQFLNYKKKRPYHFYIELERNGDLKYQDYLIALGANYRIATDSATK